MKRLNSYRNIASNDDPMELIELEHLVHDLAEAHGIAMVESHIAQALIDLHEDRFMRKLSVRKGKCSLNEIGFRGDHVSFWEGDKGIVYRCDEYPRNFDYIFEFIQKCRGKGLDGYITSQSTHNPGATFGIVTFNKGSYTTYPGI